MAICITFGTHEFTSMLQGYEKVQAYCYNCHNWNARCVTRWPWFTICFIPVIPLGSKYKEVTCFTCRFTQFLKDRPDITPETRPPPGVTYGPPPQGASYGPKLPPQAHGGGGPPQWDERGPMVYK